MTGVAHVFSVAVVVVLVVLLAAAVAVRAAVPLLDRHDAYEERTKAHRQVTR